MLPSPNAILLCRRLKEVVYTLNNYNQNVMQGLWKDAGYKMTKKIKDNGVEWFGFFLFPTVGTYMCVPLQELNKHEQTGTH